MLLVTSCLSKVTHSLKSPTSSIARLSCCLEKSTSSWSSLPIYYYQILSHPSLITTMFTKSSIKSRTAMCRGSHSQPRTMGWYSKTVSCCRRWCKNMIFGSAVPKSLGVTCLAIWTSLIKWTSLQSISLESRTSRSTKISYQEVGPRSKWYICKFL